MKDENPAAVPGEAETGAKTGNEHRGSNRDPEERPLGSKNKAEVREKMLDKTLADSFPTSDPPSTIPDPSEDSLG
jgi:hypothetical protein